MTRLQENDPVRSDWSLPAVRWDIDAEMAATDRGEWNPVWLRVECPCCGREGSPLVSCLTTTLDAGWKWIGISYQAPYQDHVARCPGCRERYRFTTYWPQ